jgi:hypothetical protein
MKHQKLFALAAALVTTTVACSQAPAPPTSPAGSAFADTSAGPDGSTLKTTAPVAVSPVGGVEVTDLDPDLVITNGQGRFVQSLALSYVFEVTNQAGQVVYRSAPVPAGAGGRTSHEIAEDLEDDQTYTWRAYAVYQGQRGPMSTAASFKALNKYGVSCAHAGNPLGIVACRYEQHGGNEMDHEELIQFMREVAFDLNQLGISDKGGFGLAVKTIGNNCLGYSCDIICEGHGNDQNQYDILIDERIPNWAEVSEVSVRECEIIR